MKSCSLKRFMLLSLCNTMYKLVLKMVVNRLKDVWKMLIAPHQASFVPGYQSINNVILCQEFVHSMRFTKARKGAALINLDLEKAFDQLEWGFIEETLQDAGLPDSLASVIMKLVSSGSYRMLWNGETTDDIRPSRGLR